MNRMARSSQTGWDCEEQKLVGGSPAFKQLLAIVDSVASNDCVVLLEGESGTGKELIAQRIHEKSARANHPFIPVNCPAVSETLFESQFYGHVKGSFTGAASDTLGMVRAADGGTLFLDEIGELPIHLQPKLLRLLQEKEVTPVGDTKTYKVNVRFVAATNRSLAKAVADGRFRRDLYHRLNVVRVHVPPLRQRPEDVEALADFFLERFAAEYNQQVKYIAPEIRQALRAYGWPGNVRELSCWVERLYAANMPAIPPMNEMWDDQYAYAAVPAEAEFAEVAARPSFTNAAAPELVSVSAPAANASLEQAETDAIRSALAQCGDNRSRAADMLNIHRTTLIRKIKQYGL